MATAKHKSATPKTNQVRSRSDEPAQQVEAEVVEESTAIVPTGVEELQEAVGTAVEHGHTIVQGASTLAHGLIGLYLISKQIGKIIREL